MKKRKPVPEEPVEAELGTNDERPPAEADPVADQLAESGALADQLAESGAPADQLAVGEAAVGLEVAEELPPEQLREELLRTAAQAEEYLDGWQRARAEFANYRKRVERDQEEARARIAGQTLLRVLGILDDLERALKDRPADGDAAAWADGIEMIYRKFQAVLESEGVQPILAEGQSFDPALHEALSHEESEGHSEGDVIEVVQRGYRVGDRVLRPAMVRVAK